MRTPNAASIFLAAAISTRLSAPISMNGTVGSTRSGDVSSASAIASRSFAPMSSARSRAAAFDVDAAATAGVAGNEGDACGGDGAGPASRAPKAPLDAIAPAATVPSASSGNGVSSNG
ncbi:Uncharacterised protein [Burkholderia pseudomallei]|nr:Uncharacterised protein [Burkholderia pseudomallei]VBJ33478.1 Uncharacterised protein [Burkholderia pseudomallei]VBM50391.1 Uncharacterised protein [Burkholderia pseudomallei]VBT70102.1 Uncharacterised protein [Burkholderia pseudomallei]VBY51959.1 Uncharacterised protein [Burkholderia pseudomallei]